MKTANVYEIERALQQPITPQQRQTAAANNPVAALLAQRLDGVEGSLRTKMQTPPPPQGTVMNQYYQWPQQQPNQLGLAQPGLEELAQQYAAGGLVAFADGGPVYDVDGSDGYAGGGDVRGFSGGSGISLHEYPWHVLGEGLDPSYIDENTYGPTQEELERYAREHEENKQRLSPIDEANKQFVTPGGVKGLWDAVTSSIGGPRVEDPTARAKKEYESIHGPLTEQTDKNEPSFLDKAKRVLGGIEGTIANTSNEYDKLKERLAEKSAKQQAEVDAKERPGTSVLSPAAWSAGRGAGLGSMLAGYEGDNEVPRYSGLRQEGEAPVQPSTVVITEPEHREAATQITSRENGLSADQQIAELEKYFQTDTSEAMRIKGEMERDNAKANNLDIFAAMMGAIGLGMGTNAPKGQQWGAGLAGLASGLSGASKMADARQGKLDELALKIKEMEGSGTRKAAETVLSARAKAAADAAEMRKALAVEEAKARLKNKYSTQGGMNEYQTKEIEAKAYELALKDYEKQNMGNRPNPQLLKQLQDYYMNKLRGLSESGAATASATPARSLGQFSGGSFTPYT